MLLPWVDAGSTCNRDAEQADGLDFHSLPLAISSIAHEKSYLYRMVQDEHRHPLSKTPLHYGGGFGVLTPPHLGRFLWLGWIYFLKYVNGVHEINIGQEWHAYII